MIPRFNISKVTNRLLGKPQGVSSIIFFQRDPPLNHHGTEYDHVCRIRIDDIKIDITEQQRVYYSKPGKFGFEVEAQAELGFGEVVLVDVSDDFIEFDVYFDETDIEHDSQICSKIANIVSRVL